MGSDVADGPHTFSGVLKKLSGDETIADSSVTVEADTTTPEPSSGISRSLPAGPAAPGDVVVVTINNVGLADGFGDVVETLPVGFSYVDDSAASDTPNAAIGAVVSGLTVTFTVVAVDSLTYKVTSGLGRGGWTAYFLRRFEEAERRGYDCRFQHNGLAGLRRFGRKPTRPSTPSTWWRRQLAAEALGAVVSGLTAVVAVGSSGRGGRARSGGVDRASARNSGPNGYSGNSGDGYPGGDGYAGGNGYARTGAGGYGYP